MSVDTNSLFLSALQFVTLVLSGCCLQDERAKMYLAQEIELMRRLKHQNIVTLHDVIQEEDHLYMILEYCAGGKSLCLQEVYM